MSLVPVNQEQAQQTAQVVLALLSDAAIAVPGNMLEGIVSGKSLLRGVIAGQLVICQNQEAPKSELPPVSKLKDDAPKKKSKKKSKKTSKA